jgi:hypothetical protein
MFKAWFLVYERHFLQLLLVADFGDGGQATNAISSLLLKDTTCKTNVTIHSLGGRCK